eukprot:GILJ01005069.1.p1 GENE.GILJ01005069.1~~GILJ01005069.1.p1  ORF type:complete len:267 (-),score=34.46 GILJ01005069.1:133-933(-)
MAAVMTTILALLCVLPLVLCATETITATVYADNYFEFYLDGVLIKTDPLDFTPHNAVKFTFTVTTGQTRVYGFVAKDFATSSGYEYTSTVTPKLGDGALRAIFSDGVGTSANWKCFTTSYGPTATSIAAGCSASNLTPCAIATFTEPTDWKLSTFDASSWSAATTYTADQAGWGKTPSYDSATSRCTTLTSPLTAADLSPNYQITTADECLAPLAQTWGDSSFIWQGDLEKDNSILCRYVVGSASSVAWSALPVFLSAIVAFFNMS